MEQKKIDSQQLKDIALNAAMREGFVCVGVAAAGEVSHSEALRKWLARGLHGNMHYMAEREDLYCNVTKNFPWAKSILCLGAFYGGTGIENSGELFARYATGRDYHKILFAAASNVAKVVQEHFSGELQLKVCVDTAPMPERHLAADAGIGWIGRSGMLINDIYGTRLLLAEIVLGCELPPDLPVDNHCLQCRMCQKSCPNSAIIDYAVIDARRCNSWATIENKGELDPAIFDTAGFVFGCDCCANACPFSQKSDLLEISDNPLTVQLHKASAIVQKSLLEILQLDYDSWDEATRGSAVRRCGYEGLLRNASIAAGYRKAAECKAALERLSGHESQIVSDAAKWAVAQLD